MGRSCPTYRTVVKEIIREWQPFRRKLDRERQEAFDRVMIKMQMHSDAGAYAAFCNPVETMFMSALIEYQKLPGSRGIMHFSNVGVLHTAARTAARTRNAVFIRGWGKIVYRI